METKDKTITATEFKAKCLRILEELGSQGIVILKHGRPIAKVIPFSSVDNQKLIGSMKGKIKIKGNILSTGTKWDAQS